jgi:hypothetical protein
MLQRSIKHGLRRQHTVRLAVGRKAAAGPEDSDNVLVSGEEGDQCGYWCGMDHDRNIHVAGKLL